MTQLRGDERQSLHRELHQEPSDIDRLLDQPEQAATMAL